MKLDLQGIEDFKLRRLFKMVDVHNKKYIDSGSVRRYLQNMGHQVLPEEVKAIIRRLDIDGDQKINFDEFVESISPVSPDFIPAKAITDSQNQIYLDQTSTINKSTVEQDRQQAIEDNRRSMNSTLNRGEQGRPHMPSRNLNYQLNQNSSTAFAQVQDPPEFGILNNNMSQQSQDQLAGLHGRVPSQSFGNNVPTQNTVKVKFSEPLRHTQSKRPDGNSEPQINISNVDASRDSIKYQQQ